MLLSNIPNYCRLFQFSLLSVRLANIGVSFLGIKSIYKAINIIRIICTLSQHIRKRSLLTWINSDLALSVKHSPCYELSQRELIQTASYKIVGRTENKKQGDEAQSLVIGQNNSTTKARRQREDFFIRAPELELPDGGWIYGRAD